MKNQTAALFADLDEKKKNARHTWIRMGVLAALLLTSGVLLLSTTPHPGTETVRPTTSVHQTPGVTPTPDYGRTAREAAYDKDMAALQALVAQQDTEEKIRNQAAAQLARMVQDHQIELGVEEALQNAGFASCMALMLGGALTVTVNAPELTQGESAAILSICVAHSDVAAENIRIMTGSSS